MLTVCMTNTSAIRNEDIDDKNKGDRVIAYPADRLLKKCNSEKAANRIENTIENYYEEKYKNE